MPPRASIPSISAIRPPPTTNKPTNQPNRPTGQHAQVVMAEKQGDPEFEFLFDLGSAEHTYYRWRLYSLAGARAFCMCGGACCGLESAAVWRALRSGERCGLESRTLNSHHPTQNKHADTENHDDATATTTDRGRHAARVAHRPVPDGRGRPALAAAADARRRAAAARGRVRSRSGARAAAGPAAVVLSVVVVAAAACVCRIILPLVPPTQQQQGQHTHHTTATSPNN